MRFPQVAIVALLGWATPSLCLAGDTATQEMAAEQDFLRRDLKRLAERGVWQGVERRYRELCAMEDRGVVLEAESHLLAAEAARNLGDINGLVERLLRARDAGADVAEAIADVLERFGQVELSVETRSAATDLTVDTEPFALEARQAIAAARQALADDRRYTGYLPLGRYQLADSDFQVFANAATQIVVAAPRSRGSASASASASAAAPRPARGARPEAPPSAEAADRPGMLLRLGASGGGRAAAAAGLYPGSAAGFVPRASLGAHLPLGPGWALRLEAGWTALLTGASHLQLGLAQASVAKQSGAFTWVAGALFAGGGGRSQGLDAAAWQAGCVTDGCDGQQALTEEAASQASLSGRVFGPGAELGVHRAIASTSSLQPAFGLSLGGWTDGAQATGWLGLNLSLLTGGRD